MCTLNYHHQRTHTSQVKQFVYDKLPNKIRFRNNATRLSARREKLPFVRAYILFRLFPSDPRAVHLPPRAAHVGSESSMKANAPLALPFVLPVVNSFSRSLLFWPSIFVYMQGFPRPPCSGGHPLCAPLRAY